MTDEQAEALFSAEFGNIDRPNFASSGNVHDWRNYIYDELANLWETFTPIQKLAIARNAQVIADREEWE
jgi:hypothetical protein